MKLFPVLIGGALGASLRFIISSALNNIKLAQLPWGTISVNLIGCFLIGLLWGLLEQKSMSESWRLFLFAGCLGSFTTFSTFGLDSVKLFQAQLPIPAISNILLSNLAGILLLILGLFISRYF